MRNYNIYNHNNNKNALIIYLAFSIKINGNLTDYWFAKTPGFDVPSI